MLAVACSKPPALEMCSDSVWYFIGYNAEYLQYKRVCYNSQTDPVDAPLTVNYWKYENYKNNEIRRYLSRIVSDYTDLL